MRKPLISTLTPICCLAVLLLVVLKFSFVHVIGISMWPTIRDNQFAVEERYWFREPQRGDVIVFKAPPAPKSNYVKRIIGIPGDIISIDGATVTLDGVTLSEPYVSPSLQGNPNSYQHLVIVVPPDNYFVEGDDRKYSYDSRAWGFVPRQNIAGRLVYLYGSPDNTGFLLDASVVFTQIHPTGVFQTSYTPGNTAASGSVLLIGFPALSGIYNTLLLGVFRKRMQNKKEPKLQGIPYRNHPRNVTYWLLNLVPPVVVLLLLCSCSILPPTGHQTKTQPDPRITPIVSSHQPNRLVSVLIDTPPYFEVSYFKAVINAIADRVLEMTNVNQDGLTVFVSFLGHDSVHTKVISITVPPLPADPPRPTLKPTPDLATYQSPYDYADAVAKVKKTNADLLATWQAQLTSNHQLLERVRAEVKKATDALRAQPVIWDDTGADIYGGLFLASQDFQNSKAVKTLVIASPLIQNTAVNATSTINLAGSTVNVIYHACETMTSSVCSANSVWWKQTLLNFNANVVNFYTPAQSQTWHITF